MTVFIRARPHRHHRSGLCWVAAGAGFRRGGLRGSRFRRGSQEGGRAERRHVYIKHIGSERVAKAIKGGRFKATTNFDELAECDAILICVPTPLGKHREPDLSFIHDTSREIAKRLRKGQLVVLESTTYPGTTDDEVAADPGEGVGPALSRGLSAGVFTRARGSGQPEVSHQVDSEGRRRREPGIDRRGGRALRGGRRQSHAGVVGQGGRVV